MIGFATARLRVTDWQTALADSTQRSRLEHRLTAILTPPVLKHLPPSVQLSQSSTQIADWIDQRTDAADVWPIETETDLIGLMFLFAGPKDGAQSSHLGYLFAQEVWGQGYASEVVQGLIRHKQKGPSTTLFAGVANGNPASSRVLLKAGFEQVAIDPDTLTQHFQCRITGQTAGKAAR